MYPPWAFGQKPEIWPAGVESMYLGSSSYTETELRGFLARNDWWEVDDASLFLAVLTAGARLNAATGVVPPADVGAALLAADAWFDANADGDGRLPYGVSFASAAGDEVKALADVLEPFNTGQTGIPLCY